MNKMLSLRMSNIPEDLYLSPSFLFDWWDGVVDQNGAEAALDDQGDDFKLARELWVAAIFASCKRKVTGVEHWVGAVKDNAPDAIVAFFMEDDIGMGRHMYPIEVTTYGKHSGSLEEVLGAKLKKSYSQVTRIVCYITDRQEGEAINLKKLAEFVRKNNLKDYEVWILGSIKPRRPKQLPLRLVSLTHEESYVIDYNQEKFVKNTSEALRVGEGKSTDKTKRLIGRVNLEFPKKSLRS